MRLAICTLSAVLLSGCSWLGMGGSEYSSGYASNGAYGDACGQSAYGGQYQAASTGYGANGCAGYGQAGYGAGANGYGAGAAGYGQAGYGAGANGYGAGAAGYGQAGYGAGAAGNGANGYGISGFQGTTGYGIDQATGQTVALNGSGAYGGQYGATGGAYGTQYGTAGGAYGTQQYASYGGVQTIQGAPIYQPQPYPAYYQAPRLRTGGSAMPFAVSLFGGQTTFNSGELFMGEIAKAASTTRDVSALSAMDYSDAFDAGTTVGGAFEYDLSRDTTLFASISKTEYDGKSIVNGTVTDNMGTVATTDDVTEAGIYTFSDMEETAIEGGLRQYVGQTGAIRPYVSASAGFVHNNDVTLTTSTDGGTVIATPETQTYIAEGWHPMASGMIGAEMAVGANTALGIETGLRWTEERSTNLGSDATWSVPLQVRGRMAF